LSLGESKKTIGMNKKRTSFFKAAIVSVELILQKNEETMSAYSTIGNSKLKLNLIKFLLNEKKQTTKKRIEAMLP
jgi:3-deoxy-D-manno-octulosonic-acid transferase